MIRRSHNRSHHSRSLRHRQRQCVPGVLWIGSGDQSAVGDIFNWFVDYIKPGGRHGSHETLTKEPRKLKPGESDLLALDWNNDNRTILVDQRLTGLLLGQTLYHDNPRKIYRALIEATAFGALTIINRFRRIRRSRSSRSSMWRHR